jgi:excisionase family DNA binding protein
MEQLFMNTEDVSKMLNIAKSTLYNYVKNDQIPHIKIGGIILFSKPDLFTWIDSKKVKEKAE